MNKKQRLEAIEKRRALSETIGNTCTDDLRTIFDYLYRDVMIDMIMKCDIAEIEHAINRSKLEE